MDRDNRWERVKTAYDALTGAPAPEAEDLPAPAVTSPIPGFQINAEAHALDAKAKAYQSANPGVSYIDAVKAVQAKGA